jgi:hypothetical protein
MTEPGFPQPVRSSDTSSAVRSGDRAQVINATGALKNHAAREALNGEVISENKDGSTTIRTDKGDVTVMLRTRDKPPEGAKVVVDLPAGNPPRQATIARAKVEQAQAQQQQQAVDATKTSSTSASTPQTRPAEAQPQPEQQAEPDAETSRVPPQTRPLDQKTSEELTRQARAAQASLPVNEELPEIGDLVRLLPLPPGETIDRAAALVKLIAEQAVLDLPAALTQTTKAPLPYGAALPPLTEEAAPNILTVAQPPKLAPLLIQKTQAELITPRELDLPPVLLFAKLAQAQIRPALGNLQAFESGAKIAGPLSTLTPGAATPVVKPSGMFDAEIKGVSQPPVKIGMPGETAVPRIAGGAPVELPKGIAGQGSGTIAGLTPKGLPVLSVAMPGSAFPQQFAVQTGGPAGLAPGAEILFTPKPAQAQGVADEEMPPLTSLGLPLPGAAQSWPALQELMATLQQAAPQAAQAMTMAMARIAPNAASPDKIPAAALLFLAAARAGDLAGWFGERSIDTLRRAGKAGLIEKLAGEAEGSARSGDRAGNTGEWRALNLPFFHDGEAQRLALYYRHDGGGHGDEGGGKKRGTRFIFDLSLSRMGAVQLDGLSRGEKLDLIVRTQAPLSQQMQMAMRRAYIDALENTGIAGEMAFQNKAEQWVRITGAQGQTVVKT